MINSHNLIYLSGWASRPVFPLLDPDGLGLSCGREQEFGNMVVVSEWQQKPWQTQHYTKVEIWFHSSKPPSNFIEDIWIDRPPKIEFLYIFVDVCLVKGHWIECLFGQWVGTDRWQHYGRCTRCGEFSYCLATFLVHFRYISNMI